MSTIKIYKLGKDNINFDNLLFEESGKQGRTKLSYISYNDPEIGQTPFIVELPYLYKIDSANTINIGKIVAEIMVCLIGKNDSKTYMTNKFFNDFEASCIKYIKKNKEILTQNMSNKNLKFKSLIRYIDEETNCFYKNGILKLKILDSENHTSEIYDDNNNILGKKDYLKLLNDKCYVKAIISFPAIYRRDGIISIYPRLYRVKASHDKEPIYLLSEYSLNDSRSDNCDSEDYKSDSYKYSSSSSDYEIKEEDYKNYVDSSLF